MAGPPSFECTVNNRTAVDLKVHDERLTWGKWIDDRPPVDIPAMTQKPAFGSIVMGAEAGATGEVAYRLGDDAGTTVVISWDVTFGSQDNTLKIEPSDPAVIVEVAGWDPHTESATATLTVHDHRTNT